MVTLLIVASTLGRDGTSRFITYLANNLTKSNKVRVKLLFFRNISEDSKSMLDDDVEVSCLEVQGKLWSSFYKILNNVLNSKADFCLFGFHQLLWLSLINFVFHLFGIKILLRDTIIPSLFHASESRLRTIINRIAYRKYDYIIAQSKDMFDDLSTNWRCDKDKMMVINNPVDINSVNNSVGDCPQELLDKHIYKEMQKALAEGTVMKYLQKVPIHKDDLFFIPAGTIHAIGAGALVAEIQESSNLTYRLYDYDRIGKDGKKRELHIDKALDVADLHGSAEPRQPLRVLKYRPGMASELLIRCKYFEVYRMLINTERRQTVHYRADRMAFRVLLCMDGCGTISYDEGTVNFYKGDCVFVPADSEVLTIHGQAQFLDIRG